MAGISAAEQLSAKQEVDPRLQKYRWAIAGSHASGGTDCARMDRLALTGRRGE
jgi:hypothetical protein